MKYRVIGCDRVTGIDVDFEIEASSVADATTKANKMGILISGSPAAVSSPAAVASRSSRSPLLIVSLCSNILLIAVLAWMLLRQPNALPPETSGSVLQRFRDKNGPPTDSIVQHYYKESDNLSSFISGVFEITGPEHEEAIFMRLGLIGNGRTLPEVSSNGFFCALFEMPITSKAAPSRDHIIWIVDGVRFEGEEAEGITREDGMLLEGKTVYRTIPTISPALSNRLARARKVQVLFMGVECDLSEQSVQRIREYFSHLSSIPGYIDKTGD